MDLESHEYSSFASAAFHIELKKNCKKILEQTSTASRRVLKGSPCCRIWDPLRQR
jgi:hypothetical protein